MAVLADGKIEAYVGPLGLGGADDLERVIVEFMDGLEAEHRRTELDSEPIASGSFNYTKPANDYNDENLFFLGSTLPKVEDITVDKAKCQDLARHIKKEIERIIAHSQTYVP